MSTNSLIMLLSASTAFAAVAPVYGSTTAAPAYTTGAPVSDCAKSCVEAYRACQSAPDANQSLCASKLAGCVNYNPFDNSGSFVTPTACSAKASATVYSSAPVYTTSAPVSDCAKTCVAAFDACQTAPDANHAFCASKLAECVNYNPFTNTATFVTPTACSAKASATAYSSAPVYTTSAPVSDCAKKCNDAFQACQTAPDANHAFCASKLAECVNYNPFTNTATFVSPTACSAKASATVYSSAPVYTTSVTGDSSDCAKKCVAAFRTCQSDLNNTRAQCASDLASCVNYNPFDNSGSFVTPTACSSSAAATVIVSTVPASYAPGSPAPAPSAPVGTSDCAKNCVTAFRTCQSDLNNTRAQCASDLASCVNYNPFDNSGSFVTPTACSASATATSMPAATNGTMATGTASATYSAPAQYSGGASLMSGSFMAIAAGALGLMI